MTIGFTGHQRIDHSERWDWVRDQIRRVLKERTAEGDRALSSLAEGGDQIFVESACALGLAVDVVLPSERYETTFDGPAERARYFELLARAASVKVLDYNEPSEEAYLEAGKYVVDHVDLLLTLWNGKPAAGKGGTGDIVEYARTLSIPTIHIHPDRFEVIGP
jgi:hypothetical protein